MESLDSILYFALFVVAIFNYVVGVEISRKLMENEPQVFERLLRPKFYYYGPKEYKALWLLLIGDRLHIKDKALLHYLSIYKKLFIVGLILSVISIYRLLKLD